MARRGEVPEVPSLGVDIEFRRTSAETGGALVAFDLVGGRGGPSRCRTCIPPDRAPGAGPPPRAVAGRPASRSARDLRDSEAPVEPSRTARAVRVQLAGVDEQAGRLDVAAEVGGVDRLAGQRLVEPLRLAEREVGGEERSSDAQEPRLLAHAGAQAPEPVVDD